MIHVQQITANLLGENRGDLESYLESLFSPFINEQSWMKDWRQLAQRFRLYKFADMPQDELKTYEWDASRIEEITKDTFREVSKHLPYHEVTITFLPALPFPWFENLERSMWTNGFTNSPNHVLLAIPPNPDEQFLRYMIAHELHHATPINPIYTIPYERFTIGHWYLMEGGAEFFSLSLYPDKRWWKDDFTEEVEQRYLSMAYEHFHSTDDKVKGPLCFGAPDQGIPFMAGYVFAYRLVKKYAERHPSISFQDLLSIQPSELIEEFSK